ncbi:MAG: phenylalanine--tRNA ligase subunit beta [Chthoniobacterales bacterium]|nr:phenylalanine--tRNA ligase subunit beta [Chthoniobacterales bacterium]
MKFSVNWLRDFVEIPGSVEELADLLTFAGIEIEGIERRGLDLANVVVAQINASSQHPNADRLSVCEVDDGTNHQRQIVCGAKNYHVGDKVLVALPGAALPNGLKIKASKLRGVESQGMLCSPSELGISADSDGLLILSSEAQVGAPIGSLFPPDTVLDVEITPNRSDLLSYAGLAREIAALRGASFQLALPDKEQVKHLRHESVAISALRECPFYSARRIENVTVGPSPAWLRAKLESAGLRPINNIVDITNFVMLELGQPLHAFDADKLQGGLHVRLAVPHEKFFALDGRTYALSPDDLMIADETRAVGIAGVMGGEETGVTDTTRTILLESACFLPSSVRRTARTLNLPSDASYRFERGVDPAMTLRASQRAVHFICDIAGGRAAEFTAVAGDIPAPPADVALRYQRCERLLGISLPREEVDGALQNGGLSRVGETSDASTWKIPTYRPDLKREADLIEEVIRHHGINEVPGRNRSQFTPVTPADRSFDFESRLRQGLRARGFSEARTSALIPRETNGFAEEAVALRNPLSEDHVALRPSLLPGLLAALSRNIRSGAPSVRLFELGRIFAPPDAREERHLALLCSGQVRSALHWRGGESRRLDFFDLKGAAESLTSATLSFRRSERKGLALAAEILERETVIGFIGQLAGSHATKVGATSPVFVLEINVDAIVESLKRTVKFRELAKFPSVTRDIAMIVPEALTHREIEATLQNANEPLLGAVQLFDLFSGKEAANLGAGRKSLAYTLTYRDKNRTLTNDEVTVADNRIRERLKRELGAELRE